MWDHFNLLAPIYDKVIQPKPPERLSHLLDLNPATRLLDVGGGTGRITQFLVNNCSEVILLDTSLEMLQKSRLKNGLTQINGASEQIPFQDNRFDRILMVDALHHVFDQQKTAQELWRVLKPGGRIVIEEPDISKFGVKMVAIAEKIALMRSHFLTSAEIGSLFSALPAMLRFENEDHFIWVIVDKPDK
jgi:demethylmenaquinone methyltransferase/2-methoxy-6-polyprenyl-1,4-benzoquinol methylase